MKRVGHTATPLPSIAALIGTGLRVGRHRGTTANLASIYPFHGGHNAGERGPFLEITAPESHLDTAIVKLRSIAGDLILTGTPSGVGMALDPPSFLQAGDSVRIEIEGLGVIEHGIVDG